MKRCILLCLCLLCGATLGSLPAAAGAPIWVDVQEGPAGIELPVAILTRTQESPPFRLGEVKIVDGEVHIDVVLPSETRSVAPYDAVLFARLPKLTEGSWPVKVFARSGETRELAGANYVVISAAESIRLSLVGEATENDEIVVRLSHSPSAPPTIEKGLGQVRITSPENTTFTPNAEGYEVALGRLPAGEWRIELVHGISMRDQQLLKVEPAADPIVLAEDFELEVQWRTAAGETGKGRLALPPAEDSALLYFFSPANWELMVKVLDGCAINGHFWVFAAASTDVGFTIDISRRNSDQSFHRDNPVGVAAPAITDIEAFPCDEALSSVR